MTTEDRDSPEEEVPQQARHELDPEALGAPSVQLIDQLAREAHTDWELAVPAYERPAEERALNLHGAEGLTRAVTAPTAATAVPGVSDPMVERPPAAASTEHVQPLSEPELQRIAAIGPAASEPPSLTSAPPPTFYFLPDASGGRPPATSPPGPATPGEASRLAAPAEVQSRVDGSLVDRVSPGTPGMDSRSPARPAVPAVAADAPREDEIPKADLAIPNERAYLPVASSELDALEQAIVQHLGGPMTRPPDTALPSPGLDAGQFARMPDLEMTLDPEKVGALAESYSVTLPTVGTDPWLPQDLDALRELSDTNLLAEPHLRGVPQQTMEPGAQHVPAGGTAESFYFVPDPAPATPIPTPTAGFNVDAVRRDFPILQERINCRQLAWLDNAARRRSREA